MNPTRFRAILAELMEENSFAIRAVLRLLGVEFTTVVPTLAVTCEDRPRLLVNLGFVTKRCRTDAEVKALLCHEFLHVLLRHTEERKPYTPARHLALDAVINAIIHREQGPTYTAMMSRYYGRAQGLAKLLRPMNKTEARYFEAIYRPGGQPWPAWVKAWEALYDGKLITDDIEALAEQFASTMAVPDSRAWQRDLGPPFTLVPGPADFSRMLGNHDETVGPLPEPLKEALEQSLREMNGSGIWRSPRDHGVGATAYETLMSARNEPLERWRQRTLAVLREHLLPDPRSRAQRDQPHAYRIPVLSARDRRAFLRAQWSPFLPEALWEGSAPKREGSAHVYLDVSGSMNAEMPLMIALLGRVSRWIRRPFWAFSDVVAPAVIERGQLKAQTTGGTSMGCVLEHVARTRPTAAIVVTDGYIESLDPEVVRRALAGTRFTAIVTRDGNPAQLKRVGIPYTQLEKVPA